MICQLFFLRLEDDYYDLNDKLDKYIQTDAYKVFSNSKFNSQNILDNYFIF